MKILNKYISDGTVLDIIWKSLKAGYMKDGVIYETPSGTMQGGVISPLIANIYLNELDWELAKSGYEFVRYADDSIVMCKTKGQLEEAKKVVYRVLEELGLEVAEDKTKDIDFYDDDFEFLSFEFGHLKKSKKKETYYNISPSKSSIKKFKSDLKAHTCKSYSKSFEQWTSELNPILRGKYNYFLIATRACLEVEKVLTERGTKFHGFAYQNYGRLDGYVRQRLRVNFANRGKKSAKMKDGKMLTVKYSNQFFLNVMGLVCGEAMRLNVYYPNQELNLLELWKNRAKERKRTATREQFFKYAYAK